MARHPIDGQPARAAPFDLSTVTITQQAFRGPLGRSIPAASLLRSSFVVKSSHAHGSAFDQRSQARRAALAHATDSSCPILSLPAQIRQNLTLATALESGLFIGKLGGSRANRRTRLCRAGSTRQRGMSRYQALKAAGFWAGCSRNREVCGPRFDARPALQALSPLGWLFQSRSAIGQVI